MSYSTCEDDIRRILVELPSENHCIDYKLEPYRTETYPEFIRDVIAFLNCAESFNEDRYIVIGVGESQNSRVKIGIDVSAKPMPDDNEFQNMIDMIRPRPAVQTGTCSFEDKIFGYIHILRSNIDTLYMEGVFERRVLEEEENKNIRSGYQIEAFNARGVYNYDPSGREEDELAKLWNERAVSAEGFGYLRLGKGLRDIAQSFLNQKED